MDWMAHADEDRPDRCRSTKLVEELIRDVTGTQVRKYQHVGWFLQGAERITVPENPLVERAVCLHLAIDHEVRVALPNELDRAGYFLRIRMSDRAEVREAEHRNPRLDPEGANDAGRGVGDLRELLVRRVDVHGRVRAED